MSTGRSRIHLILPVLTAEQASVLHDLCGDLMTALWAAHGDALCVIAAEQAERDNIGEPDGDGIYAIAEHDDDLPY